MKANDSIRARITARLDDIEYYQRELGLEAEPREIDEAWEIIERIEGRMAAARGAPAVKREAGAE